MALTPTTLQTIINHIRQRTGMENNQFITDAELTSEINKSLCQLDMILVSKFNDYKLTAVILSVTPGTANIALPADFIKLRGVDIWYNAGNQDGYRTMFEYSFPHRNKKTYPISGPIGFGPYQMEYRLEGSNVVLLPASVATQNNWQYRVWYTPDYIPLVNTTDTLQSYMDSQAWYEYAVVDCCIKVLAKQNLNPETFMVQKAEIKEMILKLSAPNRNAGQPASVADTRSFDTFSGGYGYGW
jgi:hypothetical protein